MQDLVDPDMLLGVAVQQPPLFVEVLVAVLPVEQELLGDRAQDFNDLVQVVFVFGDALDPLGLEQEVVGHHFEHRAGQGPHIGTVVVRVPQDHFWGPVFAGLHILSEMVGGEASIPHIHYFEEQFPVQLDLHVLPL